MHIDQVMEILKQKFTSGNSIPVERNIITREEYESLVSFHYLYTEALKEDRHLRIINGVLGMTDEEVAESLNDDGISIEEAKDTVSKFMANYDCTVMQKEEEKIADLMVSTDFYLYTEIDNADSPRVKLTFGDYYHAFNKREVCFHIHANDMPPATAWMEESSGDIISDEFKKIEKFKKDLTQTHTSALVKIIPESFE